ncbi:MAG TPA: type II secretion system protein [Phycisphaerae bacterium]|nr:type II secretion system protein [Phycisphaerae bacterium]
MLPARRWPDRSAFTLIELVTVIAILGIVALAVGGPALSSIDEVRSQAATSRLVGDIRYAQRTALSAGLRTWVVFSLPSDNYMLYIENSANPGKAGRVPMPQPLDRSTESVQFGAGPFANVHLASVNMNSTTELEFDSFGVPYDSNGQALATTGTVDLSSGVTVGVRPVSGLVERW